MNPWKAPLVFAAGILAGCMAAGPPVPAQSPDSSPPSGTAPDGLASTLVNPLIVDRTDLRFGTTVHFSRVPDVSQVHDLGLLPGLAHLVLSLPAWPEDFTQFESLNQIPEGSDVIVVLPGYPPSRAAAERWGYIAARLRIVVVVSGPPSDLNAVMDLNAMPRLERVIAQMDLPSRSGFERLQRPLSFRKLMN